MLLLLRDSFFFFFFVNFYLFIGCEKAFSH